MIGNLAAALAFAAPAMAGAARGAQDDWPGRVRAINVNPDASSLGLKLEVDTRTALELDFSYFVTDRLALELILATREHDVTPGRP